MGLLHLEFHLGWARSLKDKRRSVKSFKDRMRHRHNVAVAEVEALDDRRRAVLALTVVGNDQAYLEGVLERIVQAARTDREMVLAMHDVEWL